MTLSNAIARATRRPRAETNPDDPEMEDVEETTAETDQPEPEAEDEDKDPAAEDGYEDDEETMEEDEKTPQARRFAARGARRERKRIAAILTHPRATAQPDLAAHLAFRSNTSAKDARALLAAAKGGASPLAEKMARQPTVGQSGAPPARGQKAVADMWGRVAAKIKARRG